MNIVTVAEGVENDNQLVQLRSLGCDIAQGYLFSRAISAERVPAWLRKWSQNLQGWSKSVTERVAADPPLRSACPKAVTAPASSRACSKATALSCFCERTSVV